VTNLASPHSTLGSNEATISIATDKSTTNKQSEQKEASLRSFESQQEIKPSSSSQ
jgi:hypothetical protein